MTRSIAPEAAAAIEAAVVSTFDSGTHPIPTGTIVRSASELLTGIWATAREHGVEPADFDNVYGDITVRVLQAQIEAFNRQHPDDVDPVALVTEAVRATAELLDDPIEITEAPTATSATRAYAVLARLPQTPPWGYEGKLNLVVSLDREDVGFGLTRPWEWVVFPDQPGGTGTHATIIAPPPSPQAAAEVAAILAQILIGDLRAW